MPLQGHVDIISLTEVRGWAIDWDQPRAVLDIAIFVNGLEVGRCGTDTERPGLKQALGDGASGVHEFTYVFDPPLDRRDHHHVEVLTAGDHVPVPNGRRSLYPARPGHSGLTPILLTSYGRSGTTLLMQEFAAHPDIAVANAYPFEFKLASYYAAAWHVLTQSTSVPTSDEVDFAPRSTRDLLIGRNPWNRPDLLHSLGGAQTASLIGKIFPSRLGQFLRSIVEENYEIIAAGNGKSPHFFAEKSVLDEVIRQAHRHLFPDMKEIVLVRDPRDHLCSAKQFWKQDLDTVVATQAIELPIISRIFHENQADVLFVRYEDLILDGTATRQKIYKFIDCEALLYPHDVDPDTIPDRHRTSASAMNSVGRFRTELDDATTRRCNAMFHDFLGIFGYEP